MDSNVTGAIGIGRIESFEKARELMMFTTSLSEDEFKTKYLNDPCFYQGVNTLAFLIWKGIKDGQ